MEITFEVVDDFEVAETKLNLQDQFLWLKFNQVALFNFIKVLQKKNYKSNYNLSTLYSLCWNVLSGYCYNKGNDPREMFLG